MLLTTTLGNIALLFGSDGKASVYDAGDLGSSPGLERSPGEGNGFLPVHFLPSTPVLFFGKSHEQRPLVGYSLWGRKESDMTERFHFHFPVFLPGEFHGQRNLAGYSPWGWKE